MFLLSVLNFPSTLLKFQVNFKPIKSSERKQIGNGRLTAKKYKNIAHAYRKVELDKNFWNLGFLMFLFICGCFIKESSHSHKCIDSWLVVFRAEVRYFVHMWTFELNLLDKDPLIVSLCFWIWSFSKNFPFNKS